MSSTSRSSRAAGSRSPNVAELVDAVTSGLEQHDPTIGAALTEASEQAPDGIVTKFEGGTIASAPLTADPGTLFSGIMGFELALSNSSYLRHSDAWQAFARLVREHDAQGVDDLIVSVEAPTADGFAYPSDAVLAQALIDHAPTHALSAHHVAAVYLHVWSTSGVFRFTPGQEGCETICGAAPIPSGRIVKDFAIRPTI